MPTQAWAGANGLPLFDRSAVPAVTVDGFYGTNYSRARKPGIQPDTITYYDLPNTLSVEDNAGGEVTWETGPMYEYSDFETRDKYRAFLRGNNAYSVLEGNGEGSILVVKDSYANSFIPYLVENFAQIGIVDLRYTVEKVDASSSAAATTKCWCCTVFPPLQRTRTSPPAQAWRADALCP